jgi:hypothetical protein
MMLGADKRLKGCATRTGKPAVALDPLIRTQRLADTPFRKGVSAARRVSSRLCMPSDISNLRRHDTVAAI